MHEPRITVVTPTLNAAGYLTECLRSVWSQPCRPLEHLVIDGGSVDETASIVCASEADFIVLQRAGQTAAVNAGLRQARSAIVGWLNGDDVYHPDALPHVVELFAANPDLDMVYGDCAVIDGAGRTLGRIEPDEYDFQRLLTRGNYLAQPSVFFRKRVFEQLGYLDESLHFGMDYELWLRMRHVNKTYTPHVLAAFRWHAESKTAQNQTANWQECISIVRRYGGNWTPALMWSYARARLTAGRLGLVQRLHMLS